MYWKTHRYSTYEVIEDISRHIDGTSGPLPFNIAESERWRRAPPCDTTGEMPELAAALASGCGDDILKAESTIARVDASMLARCCFMMLAIAPGGGAPAASLTVLCSRTLTWRLWDLIWV